jgi:hypothetical protein
VCFIPLRPRFPYGLTFAHSAFAVSRTFQGRNPNGRRGSAVSTMLTVDFNTEVLSSYRFYEPRYMVLCLLVEIHFQGSLTVTNACVDREPTEVRGGRGSDSAQGVLLPPCPSHRQVTSYCNVPRARRYFTSSVRADLMCAHTGRIGGFWKPKSTFAWGRDVMESQHMCRIRFSPCNPGNFKNVSPAVGETLLYACC